MTSKHLLESVCTSHQDLFHSSRVPFLVLCGPRWQFTNCVSFFDRFPGCTCVNQKSMFNSF